MAGVLPEDRGYVFSSSLLNLKFMKKTGGPSTQLSSLPKKFAAGPTLTTLESNRREMEARILLPSAVSVLEENSISKLYDLVLGRFAFKGINPSLEAVLNGTTDDDMDTGFGDQSGRDVTDMEMAKRYSTVHGTVGKKFDKRHGKRKSGDLDDEDEDSGKPVDQEDDHSKSSDRSQRGRYFTAYSHADRGKQRKRFNRGRGGGNQSGNHPPKMQWGRRDN